jgi:hypothetical protein
MDAPANFTTISHFCPYAGSRINQFPRAKLLKRLNGQKIKNSFITIQVTNPRSRKKKSITLTLGKWGRWSDVRTVDSAAHTKQCVYRKSSCSILKIWSRSGPWLRVTPFLNAAKVDWYRLVNSIKIVQRWNQFTVCEDVQRFLANIRKRWNCHRTLNALCYSKMV